MQGQLEGRREFLERVLVVPLMKLGVGLVVKVKTAYRYMAITVINLTPKFLKKV